MQMSDKGICALVGSEGIVTSRYQDSVNVWTIGIGHTRAAGPPDPQTMFKEMSVAECMALFRKDLVKYEKAVNAAIKVPLKQHEFDALVHWHYNTGAIKTATLTKTINAGDKLRGGQQIMNWLKPPELKGRREIERAMFLKGEYPEPYATVYPANFKGQVQWGRGRRVNVMEILKGGEPVADPVPIPTPKPEPLPEPEEAKPTLWASISNFFNSIFGKA